MAPSDVKVIRQSLRSRTLIAVLAFFAWADLAAGLVIALLHRSATAFPILLMLAWFLFYLSHSYRISVEVNEDRLLVRNRFRTYDVRREDVVGFQIGPALWDPVGRTLRVLRRGGQPVEMAVTKRFDLSRRGRHQLEQRLCELESWSARSSAEGGCPGRAVSAEDAPVVTGRVLRARSSGPGEESLPMLTKVPNRRDSRP